MSKNHSTYLNVLIFKDAEVFRNTQILLRIELLKNSICLIDIQVPIK